jgi:hypothetical protein
MSTSKKTVLILGLIWCGLCALFPPRHYVDSVRDPLIIPTHAFLFSRDFEKFPVEHGYYNVDVNSGRLLAEFALIAVITGVVFLSVGASMRGFREGMPNKTLQRTGARPSVS